MCAIEAGRRGRSVAVLEHGRETGRKILISGGGRCNFTNLYTGAEHFLSENPHFAKSALARYTPADFIALVRRHGIPYHEKKLGQLFCDRSARDITNMLLAECEAAGTRIVTGCSISSVRRHTHFSVETSAGVFEAPALVVATGGLSIPKCGATGIGYDIARQFGLRIVNPRPALVPLTFGDEDLRRWGELAGVSTEATASCGAASFREKMLFTHRGLSGPAVLQLSSYWKAGSAVSVDLAPDIDVEAALLEKHRSGSRAELRTVLSGLMPRRLAERWGSARTVAAASRGELTALARGLHGWTFTPSGTEGFEKAEVTAGGVATSELDSRTMQSRRVPGLYFIGEVVDVTGHLGGYNFQWAWASGFAAGQAI